MPRKLLIKTRRQRAESRAKALFESIVPKEELFPRENCIRFTSQLGNRYAIYFTGTVSNIWQLDTKTGLRMHCLCAGPYMYTEYTNPRSFQRGGRIVLDDELWTTARIEAREQRDEPLRLPLWDFYLGQYLGLKYAEKAFLSKAHWG